MNTNSPAEIRATVLPDSKPIEILHIDDDPDFADLVATFLEREREHFSVHTETDPCDALERVQSGSIEIDCIVSNYDMPELNGLDILRRVRETNGELPFILFTGKGSEEIASEAITAGVTESLQKGPTR